MQVLLSTAYLPPINYFQQLVKPDVALIEKHEHFVKQTYRNRCTIASANGALSLSIPLKKLGEKEKISEKQISYSEKWQALHWRSIVSAYKSSPYFEYFEADLRPFYEKRYDLLFDYNTELLQLLFRIFRIDPKVEFTKEYIAEYRDCHDLRNSITPKTEAETAAQPYYQVFADKNGFIPNLSIIDYLFNEGVKLQRGIYAA